MFENVPRRIVRLIKILVFESVILGIALIFMSPSVWVAAVAFSFVIVAGGAAWIAAVAVAMDVDRLRKERDIALWRLRHYEPLFRVGGIRKGKP